MAVWISAAEIGAAVYWPPLEPVGEPGPAELVTLDQLDRHQRTDRELADHYGDVDLTVVFRQLPRQRNGPGRTA